MRIAGADSPFARRDDLEQVDKSRSSGHWHGDYDGAFDGVPLFWRCSISTLDPLLPRTLICICSMSAMCQ